MAEATNSRGCLGLYSGAAEETYVGVLELKSHAGKRIHSRAGKSIDVPKQDAKELQLSTCGGWRTSRKRKYKQKLGPLHNDQKRRVENGGATENRPPHALGV